MKGYRTIAFSIAVMLAGMVGWHVAPDMINNYLDLVFAVIGLSGIVLRLVTSTPFGAKVAADLGTTPAAVQNVIATLDPDSSATLSDAVAKVNDAAAKITGHPLADPAIADALVSLAKSASDGSAKLTYKAATILPLVEGVLTAGPVADPANIASLSGTTAVADPANAAPASAAAPVQ